MAQKNRSTASALENQTADKQRRELLAAAERRGWQVLAEFYDEGIRGANRRESARGSTLFTRRSSATRYVLLHNLC
jgi:hypothetical protein